MLFLYGLKPIFRLAETDIFGLAETDFLGWLKPIFLGWQNLQKKAEKAESKTSEISML